MPLTKLRDLKNNKNPRYKMLEYSHYNQNFYKIALFGRLMPSLTTEISPQSTASQNTHQTATDSVFIMGLKVDAIIGVYEWEQAITQPLIFEVEMFGSQHTAALSDDIKDAINYKTVCERIAELSKTCKVALLERLAYLVAEMILTEFYAKKVVVTIHKPTAIKNAQSVGVKICRERNDVKNSNDKSDSE